MLGGILSGPAIKNFIEDGEIEVDPYDPANLNPASLDLRLGSDLAVYCEKNIADDYRNSAGGGLDTTYIPTVHHRFKNYRLDSKCEPNIALFRMDEHGLLLEPGRLYLMHTLERIKTLNFVPILDGKSSIGRLGIVVHLTAGYGDPGFNGQYTLEVTAVEPARIYPGMKFCQIRFHTLVGDPVDYSEKGNYTGIRAEGPVPSMAWKQFR